MSNRTYDIIKNLALIFAPICTLIIALLQAFGVIENELGVAIASAVDTFLGTIVIVAKQIYDSKEKEEVINLEDTEKEEGDN